MRAAFHLGLAWALLLSFSTAPFAHDHHDAGVHAHDFDHWFEAPEEGTHLEQPDHDADAHPREWLAGDGTDVGKLAVEFTTVDTAFVLVAVDEVRLPFRPRAHDPPSNRLLPPRAPPAA